jgi:eukaryotic-like serine/threonine-protein kinase
VVIMLTLRALTGNLRGREFTFRAPARCVLGRSHNCQLRLPHDATVSRQHCLVELDGDSAWVQDLGSLNGTYLNGEMIGQRQDEGPDDATMVAPLRQALQDGDVLRLCDNLFAVALSGPVERGAPGEGQREAATPKSGAPGSDRGAAGAPGAPR